MRERFFTPRLQSKTACSNPSKETNRSTVGLGAWIAINASGGGGLQTIDL